MFLFLYGLWFIGLHTCHGDTGLFQALRVAKAPAVLTPSDNDTFSQTVFGGEDANRTEQIYQVYLAVNGRFFCGGSILDSETILTAAHCIVAFNFNDGRRYQVVAGDFRYDQYDGTEQTIDIRATAVHPDYLHNDFISPDIAIVKLTTSLTFNDYVGNPVRLPTLTLESRALKGDDCWLSGWGASEQGYPNTLQKLQTRLSPRSLCQEVYGSWNGYTVCAKEAGEGSCSGDSGGPMVCNHRGVPVQVGVVTFGSTNCEEGFSGYARVKSFKRWIRRTSRTL